jgi:hypothetical protein
VEQVAQDPELRKDYKVQFLLVQRRELPDRLRLQFLGGLRWGDQLVCLRLPFLSGAAKTRIVHTVGERFPFLSLGEKISICKRAPRALIPKLRLVPEPRAFAGLLQNANFTHDDAMFISSSSSVKSSSLSMLAQTARWSNQKDIRMALLRNSNTPNQEIRGLLAKSSLGELQRIVQDAQFPAYVRQLGRQVLRAKTPKKGP